jgi:hypothetical protein
MKNVYNLLETCKNKLHNSSKVSSKLCTFYFFIQSLYMNAQMQNTHKMYVKMFFNTFNNLPKPTIGVQALVFTILQLQFQNVSPKLCTFFSFPKPLHRCTNASLYIFTNAMHSPNVNSIFLLDFALTLFLLSIFKL